MKLLLTPLYSLDNWQTVLRKQYYKRDPEANPIGPEPSYDSEPESSPERETSAGQPNEELGGGETGRETVVGADDETVTQEGRSNPKTPERQVTSPLPAHQKAQSPHYAKSEGASIIEESKNWLDLPMLEKLSCMHLLTEWQFHNPQRVRTLMKDDDEGAAWVSFMIQE